MPDYKFTRDDRLLSSSDFQQVFKNNSLRVSNPDLLVLAMLNGKQNSRLGVVIGKKNVPSAVGRNRFKRAVRETFRKNTFKISLDIIVLARQGVGILSSEQLNLLLNQSWCRLRDRCNKAKENHA